jgi:hypothetical protein
MEVLEVDPVLLLINDDNDFDREVDSRVVVDAGTFVDCGTFVVCAGRFVDCDAFVVGAGTFVDGDAFVADAGTFVDCDASVAAAAAHAAKMLCWASRSSQPLCAICTIASMQWQPLYLPYRPGQHFYFEAIDLFPRTL